MMRCENFWQKQIIGITPLLRSMKATLKENERKAVASTAGQPSPAFRSELSVPGRIKSILVPLDFSRTAMRALDYAAGLAKKLNAQIHLVYVQTPDEACAVPNAGHVLRESAESVMFLREQPRGVEAERPTQFWPDNCHIRTGRAHEEICSLARELDVDLIVLASRGNTGLKRILLGSTAERVVRFGSCPVLVVRQRKGTVDIRLAAGRKFRIRKILAPIDFSECSMAGATYAAFLTKAFGAKLCLFHAVQPPAPVVVDRAIIDLSNLDDLNLKNARLDMEAFRKLDFLRDVKCAAEIRIGSPVNEICGETKRADIDLVVISTHGRSGFNRLLLGSVAEHVVRYAECPAMVVPSRSSTS